ncbi:hypothetical protein PIROE2DRAFT_3532 [Piromyces sp. E2]|nr:hypothetical protein PIROE2DRAFT_3532 [Piromyces sp. E2]|eukprot:OUM68689.1 hypothetical protein PIROE2DRAFT_3532 [Piromyces sp. E2]
MKFEGLKASLLLKDLKIPPLAGCKKQQIKIKWKNCNCIIRDLVRDILTMSHYSWTKESKTLRYSTLNFQNSTNIPRINLQKLHFNLGIIWIFRIRCDFENTTQIAIASNRVTPE